LEQTKGCNFEYSTFRKVRLIRFVCESVNAMDSNTDGKYKHISSHSLQLKCWYLQAVRCLARFFFSTSWLIQINRRDKQTADCSN
jgi:hypothetical protein